MKNKALVLLLILTIACSLFAFVACNNDNDGEIPSGDAPSGEISSSGIPSGEINSGNEESGGNNTAEDIVNSANQDYKGEDVDYSSYFVTDGNGRITAVSQYGIQHNEEIVQMRIPEMIGSEGITAFDADLSCFPFLKCITIPQCIEIIDREIMDVMNFFILIYCEAPAKPDGWIEGWSRAFSMENDEFEETVYYRPVVWNCKNNEVADNGKTYCFSTNGIMYALKNDQAEFVFSGIERVASMEIASAVKYKGISYNVTKISTYAFVSLIDEGEDIDDNNAGLTSVKLPTGLTTIGDAAFANMKNLSSIKIPNSVNHIGFFAFGDCGLENIEISDSVTHLGSYCFNACSNLESVKILQGVTEISDGMFSECDNLKNIELPDSITRIGADAFSNCKLLTGIEMPDGITSIGDLSFSGCKTIKSIELPISVISIGDWAFNGCDSLTIYCEAESKPSGWNSNWNPDNCPVVWGYKTGSGGNNTAEDIVNSANQDYKGEDVDYSSYFVTDGNGRITAVSQYGIQHNEEIVQMRIPEMIGSEGITAFDADLSCFPFLKCITIPQCIEVIDRSVFDTINYFMVIYCEAPTKPDGWSTDWNVSDFNDYYDARPVVWDSKNNEVADNGKVYCFSSKGILYALKDNKAELVFSGRERVESMQLASVVKYNGTSYDMTGILAYAFVSLNRIEDEEFLHYNNGNLTSVKIPSSVTHIGNLAFTELATLTDIEIPNSVKSIGDLAFGGVGISSIEIPGSVESFGDDVFISCHSLERVKFGQGITEISDWMFENCDVLKVVEIPASVTRIGYYAFSGCESIESIVIPSSVTSIDEGAFSACASLTIYCEAESQPSGWHNDWNHSNRPVVWGYRTSNN